jgi:hypothetical protein
MLELYNNQYDYDTLKNNIYSVSLMTVLKTQKLTADFCIKYILNVDFQFTEEDLSITMDTVKKYQQHLSSLDLFYAQIRATDKRLSGKRIDSFEDFESYMNRHI